MQFRFRLHTLRSASGARFFDGELLKVSGAHFNPLFESFPKGVFAFESREPSADPSFDSTDSCWLCETKT